MPRFKYKAKDWQGKPVKGVLEVESEQAARVELRSKYYDVERVVQLPREGEGAVAQVRKGFHAYETTKAIGFLVALLMIPFVWCAGETWECCRNSVCYAQLAKEGIEAEATVAGDEQTMTYVFTDPERIKRRGWIGTIRTSVEEHQFRSSDFDPVPKRGEKIRVRYLPGDTRIHAPLTGWDRLVSRNRLWFSVWLLASVVTCAPVVLVVRGIVRRWRAGRGNA